MPRRLATPRFAVRTLIEEHRSLRALASTEGDADLTPEHFAGVRLSMPSDLPGVIDIALDVRGLVAIGLCEPGKVSFRAVDAVQLRSLANTLADAIDRADSLGWFKEN